MRQEALLIAAAVAVCTAMVAGAVVVPGEPTEGQPADRSSVLAFEEMTMEAESVSGSTVELGLDARLEHRGAPAENVTVELRAFDDDTGLREATRELSVDEVEGERELALRGSIEVDRSSDYDLEAVVYEDRERIAVGTSRISGLDSLEPDYADTAVEFHRFARAPLPSVEYQVLDVVDGDATVRTAAYLTNRGGAAESGLAVDLVARQTDSNIVADRERVDVGELEPGETVSPEATLELPDGYNYYLDAVAYHEGVVVDTAREPATLDPEDEPPENDTETDEGDSLETEDFEVEEDADALDGDGDGAGDGADSDASGDSSVDSTADEQPGVGVTGALLAVVLGLIAAARARRGTE